MCSCLDVLGNGPACEGTVDAAVVGLLAFALSDGIECEYDEAFQREIRGEALTLGLALLGVARLQEDAGIAATLDRTTSDVSPESESVRASGRLNARKSVSGSALSVRKGSTISRVTLTGRPALTSVTGIRNR